MMEMNLGELISRAVVTKMEDPAFVEKEVHSRLDKLIAEAVDRALRSYGDAGKLIEQAVAEALKVDRLDLPSYGAVVTTMLKAQIEARVSELVAGRLSADMEELLSLAPKEVKLSQIAEKMLEGREEDAGQHIITVIVEQTEYRSTWLYLDEEEHRPDRDKYGCRHRMLLREDGTISSATIDTRDTKHMQTIGRNYGLPQLIRAYVACGTKIVLDEDFVRLGHGDY